MNIKMLKNNQMIINVQFNITNKINNIIYQNSIYLFIYLSLDDKINIKMNNYDDYLDYKKNKFNDYIKFKINDDIHDELTKFINNYY